MPHTPAPAPLRPGRLPLRYQPSDLTVRGLLRMPDEVRYSRLVTPVGRALAHAALVSAR